MVNIFKGKTVCCIASGPSLTQTDCDFIEKEKLPTIAVNSSWKAARFCDVIYAGDSAWWDENINDIDIKAGLWTCSENGANKHGINYHRPLMLSGWNSGLRAIEFAIENGAAKIILLGYDMSIANGIHFHGKHKNLKNPKEDTCTRWIKQFQSFKPGNCEIVNCSRYTELNCFKIIKLEDALC